MILQYYVSYFLLKLWPTVVFGTFISKPNTTRNIAILRAISVLVILQYYVGYFLLKLRPTVVFGTFISKPNITRNIAILRAISAHVISQYYVGIFHPVKTQFFHHAIHRFERLIGIFVPQKITVCNWYSINSK